MNNEHGVVFEMYFMFVACKVEKEERNRFIAENETNPNDKKESLEMATEDFEGHNEKCDGCHKTFPIKNSKHLSAFQVHKNNCSKMFMDRVMIKQETVSSGFAPGLNPCDQCAHVSSSVVSLGIHVRNEHGETSNYEESTKEKKAASKMLVCDMCDKSYALRKQLDIHKKVAHSQPADIQGKNKNKTEDGKQIKVVKKERIETETSKIKSIIRADISVEKNDVRADNKDVIEKDTSIEEEMETRQIQSMLMDQISDNEISEDEDEGNDIEVLNVFSKSTEQETKLLEEKNKTVTDPKVSKPTVPSKKGKWECPGCKTSMHINSKARHVREACKALKPLTNITTPKINDKPEVVAGRHWYG